MKKEVGGEDATRKGKMVYVKLWKLEEEGGKEESVQEWISNDRRSVWRVTCTNAERCRRSKPTGRNTAL